MDVRAAGGEWGEHLYAAFSLRYAPKAFNRETETAIMGSHDVKGSSSYPLNYNGDILADGKTA